MTQTQRHTFYLLFLISTLTLPPVHAQSTAHYDTEQVRTLLLNKGIDVLPGGAFSYDGVPIDIELNEVDVNSDGDPELLLVIRHPSRFGQARQAFTLYGRKQADCCVQLFPETPGTFRLADDAYQGYRDIAIGGPGFEFPVYRWDGLVYRYDHTARDVFLR